MATLVIDRDDAPAVPVDESRCSAEASSTSSVGLSGAGCAVRWVGGRMQQRFEWRKLDACDAKRIEYVHDYGEAWKPDRIVQRSFERDVVELKTATALPEDDSLHGSECGLSMLAVFARSKPLFSAC